MDWTHALFHEYVPTLASAHLLSQPQGDSEKNHMPEEN